MTEYFAVFENPPSCDHSVVEELPQRHSHGHRNRQSIAYIGIFAILVAVVVSAAVYVPGAKPSAAKIEDISTLNSDPTQVPAPQLKEEPKVAPAPQKKEAPAPKGRPNEAPAPQPSLTPSPTVNAQPGKLDSLSNTKVFKDVTARQDAVIGDTDGECHIHADAQYYAAVVRELGPPGLGSGPACLARTKTKKAVRNEAYNMMNNQLPLDDLDDLHKAKAPKAIGYPTTVAHIQELIALAKKLKWKVYIVGGGHSTEAWGFNSGLVISMIHRHGVDVINDGSFSGLGHAGKVIKMASGVFWAEGYAKADEGGDLLMAGSCATVGQVGYYLGGGFGYLSGPLGFGADNVLRFDVVTADGVAKVADKKQNTELFNALRGGGHAGLAVVTTTYSKLHARSSLGCLLVVHLFYGNSQVNVAWINKLITYEPKLLHVKPKIGKGLAGQLNSYVVFNFFAKPGYDTPVKVVKKLAELVVKSGAPFPTGCDGRGAPQDAWVKCITDMGKASCEGIDHQWTIDNAEEFGANQWSKDPSTMKRSPHELLATEKSLHGVNIYSSTATEKNFVHRTSTKSQCLTQLTQATYNATWSALAAQKILPGFYVVWDWFGGGTFGPNDGSVADAHRHYKWMAIISTDFKDPKHDEEALIWTTATAKAMVDASGEPFRPHPNLYDRLHLYKKDDDSYEAWETDPALMWGDKAGQVKAAKKRFDPENLFHFPHQGHFKGLDEIERNLEKA